MPTPNADRPLRITTLTTPTPARVLHLAGEADYTSHHQLRMALAAALHDRPPLLVLDLSDLEFCDSTFLAELFRARSKAPGVPLVLATPGPQVRRLLDITGADQILTVTDSVPAAIEHHVMHIPEQHKHSTGDQLEP
ncbi:STAS domain-containing protein [Streptomyces sp. TLI_171]|uniref:STAS domain-containing protein n=1 Tax=Streptomyces sp. TLI_171 TaxID=1938859 RepID=UPI000C358A60|nr:STAS domain-containing protein [Streptomyces sp. TLI_171]RKE05047.1 anti-anti-sigma factor [Streptomyces sp. TLI_171]